MLGLAHKFKEVSEASGLKDIVGCFFLAYG